MSAAIRSVGASASLNHDDPEDPDFAIVDIRLFATTDDGERVTDPQPASTSVRIERTKLAALELSVQMSLRLRQPPTGARLEAWQRIASELAARGTTVIFSTHNLQEAERYGERLLVIADGERLFDGAADELRLAVEREAPEAAGTDFEAAFVAYLQHRGH